MTDRLQERHRKFDVDTKEGARQAPSGRRPDFRRYTSFHVTSINRLFTRSREVVEWCKRDVSLR